MKTQNTNQTKLYPQALIDLLTAEKNTFMQIKPLKPFINEGVISIEETRNLLTYLQELKQKYSKEEPTLDWAEKCINLSKQINSNREYYQSFLDDYIKRQPDTDKLKQVQIYLESILEHWIEVPTNPFPCNTDKNLILQHEDIVLEFKQLFYKELESCFI